MEVPHKKVAKIKDKEKKDIKERNNSELYETLSNGMTAEKKKKSADLIAEKPPEVIPILMLQLKNLKEISRQTHEGYTRI